MKLSFENAVLGGLPSFQRPRVGWYSRTLSPDSASFRYRCLHFINGARDQFDHLLFDNPKSIQAAGLDALIIVKRLDLSVLDAVAKCRTAGTAVFLDLCDDILSPHHPSNDRGVNPMYLRAIAHDLSGVVVPSAMFADRLIETFGDCLDRARVHVIPDIAETEALYHSAVAITRGGAVEIATETRAQDNRRDRRSIVWFGNVGGAHSTFGVLSLRPHLRHLADLNRVIPIELVVISSHADIVEALARMADFPVRFVQWSAASLYDELASASAALLTTGDDEFSTIKSSNRVLLALRAGLPVVAGKHSSLDEFDEVIYPPTAAGLFGAIAPSLESERRDRQIQADALLKRFSPEVLGKIWDRLIKSAIVESQRARRKKGQRLPLILLVDEAAGVKAMGLIRELKSARLTRFQLLVGAEWLSKCPQASAVLKNSPVVPRVMAGKQSHWPSLLVDRELLVVDNPSAPAAASAVAAATGLGLIVKGVGDFATSDVDRIFRQSDGTRPSISPIKAGPYPEFEDADGTVEWLFVCHERARGWILDAICREIGSRQPKSWCVHYGTRDLPLARNIFFSHYSLYESVLQRDPATIKAANAFIWYTHPRGENPSIIRDRLLAFEHSAKVIFACQSDRAIWTERGLDPARTTVVHGAADPDHFRGHERGSGVVGLSSAFYERKNPDLVRALVHAMPHRRFTLVGKNWNRYALFEELLSKPNFTYLNASYRQYPAIYDTFDVFLSTSRLEGGPIPLVEAMMANAVPVASRTGFAPDLIKHGSNGFLFDIDASAREVAGLIDRAFDLQTDVRSTVLSLTWEEFSRQIVSLAE